MQSIIVHAVYGVNQSSTWPALTRDPEALVVEQSVDREDPTKTHFRATEGRLG